MWPDRTRQISKTISRSKQAASSGDQTDTFAVNPAMSGSGGGISASSLALFMSRLLFVLFVSVVFVCVLCLGSVLVCLMCTRPLSVCVCVNPKSGRGLCLYLC